MSTVCKRSSEDSSKFYFSYLPTRDLAKCKRVNIFFKKAANDAMALRIREITRLALEVLEEAMMFYGKGNKADFSVIPNYPNAKELVFSFGLTDFSILHFIPLLTRKQVTSIDMHKAFPLKIREAFSNVAATFPNIIEFKGYRHFDCIDLVLKSYPELQTIQLLRGTKEEFQQLIKKNIVVDLVGKTTTFTDLLAQKKVVAVNGDYSDFTTLSSFCPTLQEYAVTYVSGNSGKLDQVAAIFALTPTVRAKITKLVFNQRHAGNDPTIYEKFLLAFPNLTHLIFRHTVINDKLLQFIADSCAYLEQLTLCCCEFNSADSSTQLTAEGLERLRERFLDTRNTSLSIHIAAKNCESLLDLRLLCKFGKIFDASGKDLSKTAPFLSAVTELLLCAETLSFVVPSNIRETILPNNPHASTYLQNSFLATLPLSIRENITKISFSYYCPPDPTTKDNVEILQKTLFPKAIVNMQGPY